MHIALLGRTLARGVIRGFWSRPPQVPNVRSILRTYFTFQPIKTLRIFVIYTYSTLRYLEVRIVHGHEVDSGAFPTFLFLTVSHAALCSRCLPATWRWAWVWPWGCVPQKNPPQKRPSVTIQQVFSAMGRLSWYSIWELDFENRYEGNWRSTLFSNATELIQSTISQYTSNTKPESCWIDSWVE